jgi:hypothetical protein
LSNGRLDVGRRFVSLREQRSSAKDERRDEGSLAVLVLAEGNADSHVSEGGMEHRYAMSRALHEPEVRSFGRPFHRHALPGIGHARSCAK